MAASLLTEETCEILDVPALRDVEVMCQLLESFGADVECDFDNNRVSVTCSDRLFFEAPFDLVKMMRASVLVLGALLIRDRTCRHTSSGRLRHRKETCGAAP